MAGMMSMPWSLDSIEDGIDIGLEGMESVYLHGAAA